MNRRIKELAEQAGYPDHMTYGQEKVMEMFAELIVRECAQVDADFVPGYGLEPFSKRFKEHYGVEE